jgi:hypothetical protein
MRQQRRKERNVSLIILFSIIAISILLTSVLLGVLLPRTLVAVEFNAFPPLFLKDPPFECPTPEFVHRPPGGNGNICIAWYNRTSLYYWKAISGNPQMIVVTFDENRTSILSFSQNLFSSPSVYQGSGFLDCTYFASNDTFVLLSSTPSVSVFTPQGEKLSEVEMTHPTEDPTSTSLFYDENDQFYVDNTYEFPADGYRTLDIITGIVGNSIPLTHELGIQVDRISAMNRNLVDGKVYISLRLNDSFGTPSVIAILNTATNIIESTCVSPIEGTVIGSISADSDGVLWIATGGQASAPALNHAIYRYSTTMFPKEAIKAYTFSLNCTVTKKAIGDSTFLVSPPFTQGSGCFNSTIQTYTIGHEEPRLTPRKPHKRNVYDTLVTQNPEMHMSDAHEATTHQVLHTENITDLLVNGTFGFGRKRSVYNTSLYGTWGETGTGINSYGITSNDISFGQDAVFESVTQDGYIITKCVMFFHTVLNDGGQTQMLSVFSFFDDSITNSFFFQFTSVGDCAIYDNQRSLRADHEQGRFLLAWVSSTRSKLCVALSQDLSVSTLDEFVFDFPGQNISKLDIAVWGDYYTACWNDLNAASPWSKCYIIEKSRMLNSSLGMPRIISVPAPHIVAVEGHKATASPFHQPPNNGPRGPVMHAFPCGIFGTITANSGGVFNMKLCQSVNFDTLMITTSDSLTTIGPYNDGVTGTCQSETTCITTAISVLDPNRYDVSTAYRHFPSLDGGIERIAFAITVGADGSEDSKILAGSFVINNTGYLVSEDTLQTFDPTTDNQYNPSITFTPDGVFWILYEQYNSNGPSIQLYLTRIFYNSTIFTAPFLAQTKLWPSIPGQEAVSKQHLYAIPQHNSSVHVRNPYIYCPPPTCSWVSRSINVFSHQYSSLTKTFAFDGCNQYDVCFNGVVYEYFQNYSLPPSQVAQ